VNDSPSNIFNGVKITTLPTNGNAKVNGTNVTLGQVVTSTEITSNLFTYDPGVNGYGFPYATFTFQVQDNG